MAIVNNALVSALRPGFSAAFARGKAKAPSQWQLIATRMASANKSTTYGWLGQFPKLSEWVGSRSVKNMAEHGYSIVNNLYEGTVGVKRTDIEDDNLGIYTPLFEEMGYATATHPDELVFALLGKGVSTECYDGQNFFDTDHPVYPDVDGTTGTPETVSNLIDPAPAKEGESATPLTPWYLLDVSRPLKPLIFQERTAPEMTSQTDARTDNVFMADEYRYGVRYRCNAGFGFWQQAICVRDSLNQANFLKARTLMQSFRADGGRPLGLGRGGKAGTLLVVPASLEADAIKLVDLQLINGGESNPCYNMATIVNCAWL
ncbi:MULTISPECIES: Mu-like prophage major head subunit gpT family protein [unclassified Desulfovibrio]|uniref:Mu-like prophage major head subunit gpT family protein n=1 Tax=unclassified Desulfovibrio TaxID=2593640 RepID=UPI0013EDB26F|nr:MULTISPECIES: Mu-like prophage major head subunit gpT family protein [unclassified Desulfovibrio]